MQEPYSMVLTSIIAATIVAMILFCYFRFLVKKKPNFLLILFLLSILPIISIFRIGSYESGDLSLHTMRTYSFYSILFQEHILPRWTPEFNVGYGDPHFLFAYFLPYFIGASLHFVGFPFLLSIKLLLAASFILSGVAMYYWIKDDFGEKAAFVGALFYLYVPYHLVDLHFRVTIAETLSFVFPPLLLLLAKKIMTKPTVTRCVLNVVAYACFIMTHQIISLLFFPIVIAYSLLIWFTKKKKAYTDIIIYFVTLLGGLFLSAFYWLPIIKEAKYVQASLTTHNTIYTPFEQLFYSPWRFGLLFQGDMGQLSFLIGYTQLFIVAAAVYLLIKKKFSYYERLLAVFFLILIVLLLFMITPQSRDLWLKLPLINYFQFSYRLMEAVALATSFLAALVVTKWNNKYFIIILCSITVLYTILNWGNRKTLPYAQDDYLITAYKNKPDIGMYLEPSSPIWADLETSKLRTKTPQHIEVLQGNAEIKQISRTSTYHKYVIHTATKTYIKENTLYFPGWTLYVDGKEYPMNYTNKKYPGVITFTLEKGPHEVVLTFQDTPIRALAMRISIGTIIILLVLLIASRKRK